MTAARGNLAAAACRERLEAVTGELKEAQGDILEIPQGQMHTRARAMDQMLDAACDLRMLWFAVSHPTDLPAGETDDGPDGLGP